MKRFYIVLSISIILSAISFVVFNIYFGEANHGYSLEMYQFFSFSQIFYMVMMCAYSVVNSNRRKMGYLYLVPIIYSSLSSTLLLMLFGKSMYQLGYVYVNYVYYLIVIIVSYILFKETKSRVFIAIGIYTLIRFATVLIVGDQSVIPYFSEVLKSLYAVALIIIINTKLEFVELKSL